MKKLIAILCGLAVMSAAHSQTTVSADFTQFGINNGNATVKLNVNEHTTPNSSALLYADYRSMFDISFSLLCNTLGTEQVFLCKDGKAGEMFADLSVGYDPMLRQVFVEMKDCNGKLHRMGVGNEVKTGTWYDISLSSRYNAKRHKSTLTMTVSEEDGSKSANSLEYPGYALRYNVGRWVVGHGFPGGFPNSLQVRNGEMKSLAISGTGLERLKGQNPIFTDRHTADPACLVSNGKVYAYVGEDKAALSGWFNMPHWVCYSTDDMKSWTCHGKVLCAADFSYATPNGAWAAQVVEHEGKYYFYVTLDDRRNGKHTIDVAVANSPTGPFRPARPDGSPIITDDMTPDSHRPNADIDPTVLIDTDGTPWMAWGNGDCYMVRLNKNMTDIDGEIKKTPMRNFSEGPWLFKRGEWYYNVYAADAPGVQSEQMAYSMSKSINGPWIYGGLLTSSAKHGFTIHPSVIDFKGKWYLFYHDGSYMINGEPGGDCRRSVCVEHLHFNKDGSIKPITLTEEGISQERRR